MSFFLLYINSAKEIKATVKQTHKESQGALGSLDIYHFIPLNSYHSEKICKGAESVLPKFWLWKVKYLRVNHKHLSLSIYLYLKISKLEIIKITVVIITFCSFNACNTKSFLSFFKSWNMFWGFSLVAYTIHTIWTNVLSHNFQSFSLIATGV